MIRRSPIAILSTDSFAFFACFILSVYPEHWIPDIESALGVLILITLCYAVRKLCVIHIPSNLLYVFRCCV